MARAGLFNSFLPLLGIQTERNANSRLLFSSPCEKSSHMLREATMARKKRTPHVIRATLLQKAPSYSEGPAPASSRNTYGEISASDNTPSLD